MTAKIPIEIEPRGQLLRLAAELAVALSASLILGASQASALKTRSLPELGRGKVEASALARARAAPERLHVLMEVERGTKDAVERRGIRLLRSVDGDLWLASVPAPLLLSGTLPKTVLRVFDLKPEDRCAPKLLMAAQRSGTASLGGMRVKVFEGEPIETVRALVEARGGRVVREARVFGILDFEGPSTLILELLSRDDVRWIEPAPGEGSVANNEMRMDAEVNAVQALGIDGAGITIGMWDSGMPDSLHPDLTGRVTPGEPAMLTTLHSTHVAGTAIGDGTNSFNQGGGFIQWRGVATEASMVNYSIPDAITEIGTAISSFDIDVSTNSWVYPVNEDSLANCDLYGSYTNDAPEYDDVVRGIYGKRIPVVFAAGNERDDGDCGITAGYRTIPPPGTAKNVITVAAHLSDLGFNTSFSSWGPTDDGRLKPDISAPGCAQFSDFGIKSTAVGGGLYAVLCGTSQATPVVSGSCAMLISDWHARYPGDPRPSTLKALLTGFAKDRSNAGPDYRFGYGAINLARSVYELQTASTIEDMVGSGQVDFFTFFVPANEDTLAVTLAWDDPAGAELADTTLVNDLDLLMVAPTSGTYSPWVLNPASPDLLATTGRNVLDNVEQVRVLSPEAGLWTAIVVGIGVVDGPQVYSLVGFDKRAPATATLFSVVSTSETAASLTWQRPGDQDLGGNLLVRSTSPIVWVPAPGIPYDAGSTVAPGVKVVASDNSDHSSSPLVDSPLFPNTLYYYALFQYDEVPNYSGAVLAQGQTDPAVDAPSIEPPLARLSFALTGSNPMRGSAVFRFELPVAQHVSLEIFDALGRQVTTVIWGERQTGGHDVEWDGRDASGRAVSSGVYFARFEAAGFRATEKLVVVK